MTLPALFFQRLSADKAKFRMRKKTKNCLELSRFLPIFANENVDADEGQSEKGVAPQVERRKLLLVLRYLEDG